MKKSILAVLMIVVVTTPCLAQEVEPEGIFSLHGTRWEGILGFIGYGFYDGEVYPKPKTGFAYYVDLGIVSFFFRSNLYSLNTVEFGIMQPIGIGIAMGVYESPFFFPFVSIAVLIKVEDNK